MRGIPAKFSILSVVLVCAAALNAQSSSGAIVYVHGNVMVNGATPGQSTSIFAGDRLDTADSSVATINRTGSSVVVNPNSSVEYGQSAIQVMHGTARVSTLTGMSAMAGPLTITPEGSKAKFDVMQTTEGIIVAPREGSLSVRDGSNSIDLQPGESRLFKTGKESLAQAGQSSLLPSGQVKAFGTAVEPPGLQICSSLKYCLGRDNVSQINPCLCP